MVCVNLDCEDLVCVDLSCVDLVHGDLDLAYEGLHCIDLVLVCSVHHLAFVNVDHEVLVWIYLDSPVSAQSGLCSLCVQVQSVEGEGAVVVGIQGVVWL